jgi:hypothetical protein
VFTFNQDHKQLLVNLLSISTSGKNQKYVWNKNTGKKHASLPRITEVVKQYYNYNTKHAIDAIPLLSNDIIFSHAEDLGYQTDQLKELKKELNRRK